MNAAPVRTTCGCTKRTAGRPEGFPQNILCDRRSARFPVPASDQIRNKLANCAQAGVYLMKDRFGTVIYVGKARGPARVSQYFHPSGGKADLN